MNNEPVAIRYDFDGYGYQYMDSGSGSDWQTRVKGEPLYTHPLKELTLSPDEIFDIWDKHTDYDGNFITSVDDFVFAILRKAQEKC
jgi:hypothetical protein